MRIWAALLVGSLPAISVTGAAQQSAGVATPPNVATAVSNVQAFYGQVTTFNATFEQTYFVKAYNQTKTSRGYVVFSTPDMMDWRYSNPLGNRIVSNGTTLWVYDAGTKQVYVQTVGQSQYLAALSFLTSPANLNAQCNFTLYPGAPLQYPTGHVLLCDPKQPTPAYTKILLYVDTGTSQVQRVLILDGQGNRNRFDFDKVLVNLPVSPQQFTFNPPQGTTVINGPGATPSPPTPPLPSATSTPSPHLTSSPTRTP